MGRKMTCTLGLLEGKAGLSVCLARFFLGNVVRGVGRDRPRAATQKTMKILSLKDRSPLPLRIRRR
jgi:hypothetical protein